MTEGLVFGPAAKPWEETSAFMTEVLDAGIIADRAKQKPRNYLGMSSLGHDCSRKLYYEYVHTPKDPGREFSGQVLRIFQRGHECETRVANYLRMSGFQLLTERPDGKQFGIYIAKHPETGEPRIAGHCDGIITGFALPDDVRNHISISERAIEWYCTLPFPMLWENKGVNDKAYKKYMMGGIKKGNPVYYGQMQLYMAYLELEHALFTAENQNTCEIFCELVKFNAQDAQEFSDRGVRVVTANDVNEFPRIGKEESDFVCKWCDYHDRCWAPGAVPNAQASMPAPTWLRSS